MWKVFLALISHRFLLLAVALFTINSRISTQEQGKAFRTLKPTSVLFEKFISTVEQGAETQTLQTFLQEPFLTVMQRSSDPFMWFSKLVSMLTPIPAVYIILLVSNLFLLLFLYELDALCNRMALPDVASNAAILAVLWVTSYELSLGSNLSLNCLLVTLAIRHAIDNQWLLTGIGMGLLALNEKMAIGLFPILLYLFWYFQRHFQVAEVLKRVVFFMLPFGAAMFWRFEEYRNIGNTIEASALSSVVRAFQNGSGFNFISAQMNAGQSISILIFFVGAVAAIFVNSSFIHKTLPLLMFTLVLAFSKFGTLASRMLLAAICFEGITAMASGLVLRLIQLFLIVLSAYEMVSIF